MDARSRHRLSLRPTLLVTGKANEYRRRPRRYQVDPLSRVRELAGSVLRYPPKPENKPVLCHSRRIEKLCHLFCSHQRPIMFSSYAWPAPATYHRPLCEHGDRRVGVGAPNERTPFIIHDAVVGFVDRCLSRTRNLAASKQTPACVFLKPILGQHLPQKGFSWAFLGFGTFRFEKRAHSKLYLKNYDGYLWNSNVLVEFCVSIDIGLYTHLF